jgi:ketosteroid isomerase-like protein
MLVRFRNAYERGAAESLTALYSEDASENDITGARAIRKLYQGWFAETAARRIRFEAVQTRGTDDGRCHAAARYDVAYRDASGRARQKAGQIRFVFEGGGGGVKIVRARY